tara:strand:- start:11663 stop:12358 length:696 start_codon:yes stop_codon:yes gene_type:complete
MADPKKLNPIYILSGELEAGTGFFWTGEFYNRPSVNGSGVLLEGEGVGESNTDVKITGSSVIPEVNLSGYGSVTVDIQGTEVRISGSAAGGAGTPGGADTQIQFNDDGSFGGNSKLTYDGDVVMATGHFVHGVSGLASHASHGAFNVDFNSGPIQSLSSSKNMELTASNIIIGANVQIRVVATADIEISGGNLCVVGADPIVIGADKTGMVCVAAFGPDQDDVIAAFSAQI